ncbi:MAG: hypothetical protein WC780_12560 [Lentimicrobiaceae bacterium]|jgi:hypothetical protein
MDLNRLTHDADDLIRKVVARYNQLYLPAGNVSQLELDLMLDDLRKLYDAFKTIGQINLTLQHTSNKPEVSVNTHVPSAQQHRPEAPPLHSEAYVPKPDATTATFQPEPEPEGKAEVTRDPKPVPEQVVAPIRTASEEAGNLSSTSQIHDPLSESQAKTEVEVHNVEKPVQDTAHNSIHTDTPETSNAMLADKFNTSNKSLSETLSSVPAQGVVGSRLLFQPIADLSTGIGLNDKFNFISELFGNNIELYEEAITRVNKAVHIDQAYWILHKYQNSDWDHKQETLARLKDFVKRRFI